MGFQIESGDQHGYKAKVNSAGQLIVLAESLEQIADSAIAGSTYYSPTDFINLTTTGSYNGVLYFKNTSSVPFKLYSIRMSSSVAVYWKLVKNPTTGTLITAGTTLVPVNTNFASGSLFTGTVLKGANGLTITDGTHAAQVYLVAGAFNMQLDGGLILLQNTSLAILGKPTATGDVAVTLLGYYHESSED